MSTVIVLGYRVGIAAALHRRGLDAFYLVEKPNQALAGARVRQVAALEDAQEVLRAVLSADVGPVLAVVTGHEQGIFTAAVLREWFGLPGDRDYARALRFRDKYLQKTLLPPSVKRARCVYAGPGTDYASLAAALGVPFIVKPANGFGATRTALVHSESDFHRHMAVHASGSDVAMVAESFVRGYELHVDGVWYGGRLVWSSVAKYHEPPMRANQSAILASQILSREQSPELVGRAEHLAGESLKGLAAPDCVFHLEAFDDGGELVFGECATRLSGAHLPEIVELTHGVDLYDAVVGLALGEDPTASLSPVPPEAYFAYIYLRRYEGVELTQRDFEERFTFHEISYPERGEGGVGVYGRVGHALVSAPNNVELSELVARIATFNEYGRTSRIAKHE